MEADFTSAVGTSHADYQSIVGCARYDESWEKAVKKQLSFKKKLLFSFVTLLAAYGLAEIVCTAIMPRPAGSIGSDTFAIQEDTGGFCVDLIRGYSITKAPTRFARVTQGTIEYTGTFRGNSQGFQGDRDFTVKRPSGVKCRTLVFGDSFTSAAFLKTRWTDRIQPNLPQTEFVNCGIDGAGLGNWWSVLTRMIVPRHYEFDRIVFAAIPHDLDRPFAVADYRCEGWLTLGYVGWNPDEFPKDVQHAFWHLLTATFKKVSPAEFDESLRRGRLIQGDPDHTLRPWITTRIVDAAAGLVRPRRVPADIESEYVPAAHLAEAKGDKFFGGDQMAMILDLRDQIVAHHWSVVVIHIPSRDELIAKRDWTPQVRDFARILNARFIDGSEPFRGLSREEILASYFPFDGHWNQTGSDRFAAYVARQLKAQ
jgi:hypothetical protein